MPGKAYRQVGVRLWGEGAYEREPVDGGGTKYAQLFRTETGDVIVNKIWARNGSVAVVSGELAGCYGSGEFPMFAAGRAAAAGGADRGGGRPDRGSLPPLPEQRRIVAELDAVQAEVDRLKALQAETAGELGALLPAVLDRAFAGAL